ncbi:uncharacterized protein LOC106458385 isoform X2 [Limulus polyphemus]|uniref:Uncharacterized protein LOC106458385 isoform X2 n=1 Tax=Limulus polyphemus TaxID=6850 RepID=A0ABM1B2A9_LIMPO|nr:uncharacterized protein LOC106458385 isoform X2 [Limulus polyphemus]
MEKKTNKDTIFRRVSKLLGWKRVHSDRTSSLSELSGYGISMKKNICQNPPLFRQSFRNKTSASRVKISDSALNRSWSQCDIGNSDPSRSVQSRWNSKRGLREKSEEGLRASNHPQNQNGQEMGRFKSSHARARSLSDYESPLCENIHSRIPIHREMKHLHKKSDQTASNLVGVEPVVNNFNQLIGSLDSQRHHRSARYLTKDSGYEGEPDYANTDWLTAEQGLHTLSGSLSSVHLDQRNISQSMSSLGLGVGQADDNRNRVGHGLSSHIDPWKSQYYRQSEDPLVSIKPLSFSITSPQKLRHHHSSSESLSSLRSAPGGQLSTISQTTINFLLDLGKSETSSVSQPESHFCPTLAHSTEDNTMVTRRFKKSVYKELASKSGFDFTPVVQGRTESEKQGNTNKPTDVSSVPQSYQNSLDGKNNMDFCKQTTIYSNKTQDVSQNVSNVFQNRQVGNGGESQSVENITRKVSDLPERFYCNTLAGKENPAYCQKEQPKFVVTDVLHEKCPSWPATAVNSEGTSPISAVNYRSHSWSNQTDYPKLRVVYSRPKKSYKMCTSQLPPVLEKGTESSKRKNIADVENQPTALLLSSSANHEVGYKQVMNRRCSEGLQVPQGDIRSANVSEVHGRNIIQTPAERDVSYQTQEPKMEPYWGKYHDFLKHYSEYAPSQSSAYGSLSSWDGSASEYGTNLLKQDYVENRNPLSLECRGSFRIAQSAIEMPSKIEEIRNANNQETLPWHGSYSDLSSLSMQLSNRSSLLDSGLSTLPDSGRLSPQSSCGSRFTTTSLECGLRAHLVAKNGINQENVVHSSRVQQPVRHDSQSVVYYTPDAKQIYNRISKNVHISRKANTNDRKADYVDKQQSSEKVSDNLRKCETEEEIKNENPLFEDITTHDQFYGFCKRLEVPKEQMKACTNNENKILKNGVKTSTSPQFEHEKVAPEKEIYPKYNPPQKVILKPHNEYDLARKNQTSTSNNLDNHIMYLSSDKKPQITDTELKAIQRQAVLSFYQRQKALYSTSARVAEQDLPISSFHSEHLRGASDTLSQEKQLINASVSQNPLHASHKLVTGTLDPRNNVFRNGTSEFIQSHIIPNENSCSSSKKEVSEEHKHNQERALNHKSSLSVTKSQRLSSETFLQNSNLRPRKNISSDHYMKTKGEPSATEPIASSALEEETIITKMLEDKEKIKRMGELSGSGIRSVLPLSVPSSVTCKEQSVKLEKVPRVIKDLSFGKSPRKAQLEEVHYPNNTSTLRVITEDGIIPLDTTNTQAKRNLIAAPPKHVNKPPAPPPPQHCPTRPLPPIPTSDQDTESLVCKNNVDGDDDELRRITSSQSCQSTSLGEASICSSPELPLPPPPHTTDVVVQPSSEPLPPPPDSCEVIIDTSTRTNSFQNLSMSYQTGFEDKKYKSTGNVTNHQLQHPLSPSRQSPTQVKGCVKDPINSEYKHTYIPQNTTGPRLSSYSPTGHFKHYSTFLISGEEDCSKEGQNISALNNYQGSSSSQSGGIGVIPHSWDDDFIENRQRNTMTCHPYCNSHTCNVNQNFMEKRVSDNVTAEIVDSHCSGVTIKSKSVRHSPFEELKTTSVNPNNQSSAEMLKDVFSVPNSSLSEPSLVSHSNDIRTLNVLTSQEMSFPVLQSIPSSSSKCDSSVTFSSKSSPKAFPFQLHTSSTDHSFGNFPDSSEAWYENVSELRKEIMSPTYANISNEQQQQIKPPSPMSLTYSNLSTAYQKEQNYTPTPEAALSAENSTRPQVPQPYSTSNILHQDKHNFFSETKRLPSLFIDNSIKSQIEPTYSNSFTVESEKQDSFLILNDASSVSLDNSVKHQVSPTYSNICTINSEEQNSFSIPEEVSSTSFDCKVKRQMSPIYSNISSVDLEENKFYSVPQDASSMSFDNSIMCQISPTYSNICTVQEQQNFPYMSDNSSPSSIETMKKQHISSDYSCNSSVNQVKNEMFSLTEENAFKNNSVQNCAGSDTNAFLSSNRISSSTQTTDTPTLSRKRKSKEELECEKLSQDFANYCGDAVLRRLLVPDPNHKTMSDYLKGLFNLELERGGQPMRKIKSTKVTTPEGTKAFAHQTSENSEEKELPHDSAYFTTSEPKAKLLTRYGKNADYQKWASQTEITEKKEELIPSIDRKLQILRAEQIVIREEMIQNETLGDGVTSRVEESAKPNEIDKYKLHVEEMEKIINLLLSISGRLARAQNALSCLPQDAAEKEKCVLKSKCEKLSSQYEEARRLKESIDKRSQQVAKFLQQYLSGDEYADYEHFIKMKSKLLIDAREIDEKIKLGEEQLAALRSSTDFTVSHRKTPTVAETIH